MRNALLVFVIALIFIAGCSEQPEILPPDAPQSPDSNLAGRAAFSQQDFPSITSKGYAPPWDVWNLNAPVMMPSPEEPAPGMDAQVLFFLPDQDLQPLVYDEAWVYNAETKDFTKIVISGDNEPHPIFNNFLIGKRSGSDIDDRVVVDIPAEALGVGDNYLLGYFCTETAAISSGKEQYVCGCQRADASSCGKWNLQRITVKEQGPAVCGDEVCSENETVDNCPSDCLVPPTTPGTPTGNPGAEEVVFAPPECGFYEGFARGLSSEDYWRCIDTTVSERGIIMTVENTGDETQDVVFAAARPHSRWDSFEDYSDQKWNPRVCRLKDAVIAEPGQTVELVFDGDNCRNAFEEPAPPIYFFDLQMASPQGFVYTRRGWMGTEPMAFIGDNVYRVDEIVSAEKSEDPEVLFSEDNLKAVHGYHYELSDGSEVGLQYYEYSPLWGEEELAAATDLLRGEAVKDPNAWLWEVSSDKEYAIVAFSTGWGLYGPVVVVADDVPADSETAAEVANAVLGEVGDDQGMRATGLWVNINNYDHFQGVPELYSMHRSANDWNVQSTKYLEGSPSEVFEVLVNKYSGSWSNEGGMSADEYWFSEEDEQGKVIGWISSDNIVIIAEAYDRGVAELEQLIEPYKALYPVLQRDEEVPSVVEFCFVGEDGCAVNDTLQVGERKTYLDVSDEDYEVTLLAVSSSFDSAKFLVNGEVTLFISEGDEQELSSITIRVEEVIRTTRYRPPTDHP